MTAMLDQRRLTRPAALLALVISAVLAFGDADNQVAESAVAMSIRPPPQELVDNWHLAPFYQKHLSIEGFSILSSEKVSDFALREAEFLLRKTIGHRPDILHALTENQVRLVVMAPTEMTTDVPEHRDLKPARYWNRRARGLGPSRERPAVSCGEENLLCLEGDPYFKENILIHEFAHAVHQMGLSKVDPTFDGRLKSTYAAAMAAGLWKGTYSTTNKEEYWAEGAQCWFNCAGVHDREHGDIDTREKIKAYDPALASLIAEVYGDTAWRYAKPAARNAEDRAHLAGFDVTKVPRFSWPANAQPMEAQGKDLAWFNPEDAPSASACGGKATTILFVNHREQAVDLDWITTDGNRKRYSTVRPKMTYLMNTFSGHAWLVSESGKALGAVIAGDEAGRAVIKGDGEK